MISEPRPAVKGVIGGNSVEFDDAVKTLETTTMMDEERRLGALRTIQHAIDLMLPSQQFKDALRESAPAGKEKAALAKSPVMR